jgi:prepilin-type N-terminal cleavage/methylation domain-containing protein
MRGTNLQSLSGYTMIELTVAMTLLGTLALSLTTLSIHSMQTNKDNEIRSGAIQAASVVLDEMRGQIISSLPSSPGSQQNQSIFISGVRDSFNVTLTFCSNPSFCPTTDTRHIKVAVSYAGRNRFNTETVMTQLR